MAQCELVLPVAIGVEAVMADAMESLRQRVKKETANELVDIEIRDLRLIVMTIILLTKGGADLDQPDEAGVGYRDTMGVATEISQDLLGTGEGRLYLDHPLAALRRTELLVKTVGRAKWARLPKKPKSPASMPFARFEGTTDGRARKAPAHAGTSLVVSQPSACHRGMTRSAQ
jgi:hypothetical protein